MKHIFYLIGICFVIYEMMWILTPREEAEKSKKLHDLQKQHKGKKLDEYSKEYTDILWSRGLVSLIFSFWMFAGLLTFNWVAFLALLIFNFVIIAPISKLFRYSFAYTALHWVNSIIGFAFGLFVIVNSYHLKIDLYQLVKAWFL